MDIKRELIKTSNIIRKKYLSLKRGIADEEEVIKKRFKPIVEPITEIAKKIKIKPEIDSTSSPSVMVKKSDYGDEDEAKPLLQEEEKRSKTFKDVELSDSDYSDSDRDEDPEPSYNKYIKKVIEDVKGEMDHTYGVYVGSDGEWMIGDSKITYLPSENVIKIKGSSFKPTRGLLELIFKKKPTKSLINQNDLDTYKDILILTNAHLVRSTEGERVKFTNTPKYKNYIKKLFKKGSGFDTEFMKLDTYPCSPDYVHYDDINDLVDRLRKLKASEVAGNTSHNNEIINIISELRRQGVIY